MQILSHRGYWKDNSEQNQEVAFRRSFSKGFGTETDIRDYNGELVISHDIPKESCITVEEFFKIYKEYDAALPLALNIKADGLQILLNKLIKKYEISNYFVFDMSIPDTIGYLDKGFNIFTRHSDYEQQPSFYGDAVGIWLDFFQKEWFDSKTIKGHLDESKKVCVVSSELHGKNHINQWSELRKMSFIEDNNIMLCTDFPEEAEGFFHGY